MRRHAISPTLLSMSVLYAASPRQQPTMSVYACRSRWVRPVSTHRRSTPSADATDARCHAVTVHTSRCPSNAVWPRYQPTRHAVSPRSHAVSPRRRAVRPRRLAPLSAHTVTLSVHAIAVDPHHLAALSAHAVTLSVHAIALSFHAVDRHLAHAASSPHQCDERWAPQMRLAWPNSSQSSRSVLSALIGSAMPVDALDCEAERAALQCRAPVIQGGKVQ